MSEEIIPEVKPSDVVDDPERKESVPESEQRKPGRRLQRPQKPQKPQKPFLWKM